MPGLWFYFIGSGADGNTPKRKSKKKYGNGACGEITKPVAKSAQKPKSVTASK